MIGHTGDTLSLVHNLTEESVPATAPGAIALGRLPYLEGGPGERASAPVERERDSRAAAAPAAILDTCTITSHSRKLARVYHRLTELEYLKPELLRSACFITLTSAKALPAEDVRRAWHRVQAWLMRHGYQHYLVTSGIQAKRRATYGDSVLHYHVIVFGHARVPVEAMRASWGLGATYHERAKDTTHAIRYVASYMRGNSGRLSWSYAMRDQLPGGFAPHVDSFRYVRSDRATGFRGGIIEFGWGGVRPVREGYSYVPALGRIVPSVATTSHTLLWRAYRMSIDWAEVREREGKTIEAENRFIERFRREPEGSLQAVGRLRCSIALPQ